MIDWRIHHKAETVSTNLDARAGSHGDVFTADYQTAGRGRLDHKWLSPPKANLMMSVVLSVSDLLPEHVSTLPLVVGLAVCKALSTNYQLPTANYRLKWPNDVLVDGKKLAGILCERCGDNVIVGIGVNVNQTEFPSEIANRATSLAILSAPILDLSAVCRNILGQLDELYGLWRKQGFVAVYPEIAAIDALRGQALAVVQADGDCAPISGLCGGIQYDGSLAVGKVRVYAGEAHILS